MKKPAKTTWQKLKGTLRRGSRSVLAALTNWVGAYPSTDKARKEIFNSWRPFFITSNQALSGNLSTLVAQCRQIERGTPLGRAVVEGLTADLIGSGIDILPDSGSDELNARLFDAWHAFCENAQVDGRSLWEWQSIGPREYCTAGAVLARFIVDPARRDKGWSPVGILPLEVEWLSEYPVGQLQKGTRFIRGIEVDALGIPVCYHLRHPEAARGLSAGAGEIVPAVQIIHSYERRRAQQNHGEPLLAVIIERCLQDSRLIETELKSAIATSAPAIAIKSQAGGYSDGNQEDDDGEPVTDMPGGSVTRLYPGEDITAVVNPRPSQMIAPFRDTIKGDIAGATRASRIHLDRDLAGKTFMNARFDQQQGKRLHAQLKECLGRDMAGRIYHYVFPWLMLALGEPLPANKAELARLMKYETRPDQPEYVDPTKDVQASINAITNNLSTYDIELSSRGKDFRQVFKQRALENALLTQYGLPLPVPVKSANTAPEQVATDEGAANPDTGEPVSDGKEGVAA